MDLNQRKLNKSEWESIEVPVSASEIEVLNLIIAGYDDVNIKINNNKSLFMFLKIDYVTKMEEYLYNKYLRNTVNKIEEKIVGKYPEYLKMEVDGIVKLNSADKIRIERNDEETIKKSNVYELLLLNYAEKMVEYGVTLRGNTKFLYYYFTLFKLIQNNIQKLNKYIIQFINNILTLFKSEIDMSIVIENSVDFIEKNENLLKYDDLVLYEHQKQIFTICKNPLPKLVLYMAPTGTGKTLTPIALLKNHKVIFVCAARHVGLALAKSAISVNKKIAFAFGCTSAEDIRLHYFAAKDFSINKRTGGIKKVDNDNGENVEMIICDIKSYLVAMYYMLAFNKSENMITYWDEPTITLDYKTHEFHEIIHENWKENIIPNMVLSSATLPKMCELTETICDFREKFEESEIHNITSQDCKKSIPIINKDGFVVLPHYLSADYNEIVKIANHCENYLTLCRYFDLKEVVAFISFVTKNRYMYNKMQLEFHFESLNDVLMKNIKLYYIQLLQNIIPDKWSIIYHHFMVARVPRIVTNNTVDTSGNKILQGRSLTRINTINDTIPIVGTSGAYITTKDSYTLTDGPTIFISDDISKIASFCIQQANIPTIVMDEIMRKIEYNNVINDKLFLLENELEQLKENATNTVKNDVKFGRNKSSKDIHKLNREAPTENKKGGTPKISTLTNEINSLKLMVRTVVLNDTFIPNKSHHIKKWADGLETNMAFTSNIDEHVVNEIMTLNGVEDNFKILLMMGIGVFMNHENIRYTEIMKKLSDEQKLYLIIANSDYIYGTNYQLCHGYLSKDLNLTQEKIIQAMGRIGRTNVQQTYTIRFRDDSLINKLFTSETEKPEIQNMNRLFNSGELIH
jgi:hypothetical protein